MGRGIQVSVKPDVLKWARITSGATVKDTADRVGVTPAAFARWETEETPLSLTQVRELSRYFKRV